MKGLTHFIIGVTAATFFPEVMQSSVQDKSFIMLLSGASGILPDTLDFKIARFFEEEDYTVDPEPGNLKPQEYAETVAEAIEEAARTGEEVRVRFHTLQYDSDKWQRYRIGFQHGGNKVKVKMGPKVSTGQEPYPHSQPEGETTGTAEADAKIMHEHARDTTVDILSGPTLGFKPDEEGNVEVNFLPWHRQWSHSFTAGIALGILGWLIGGPYIGLLLGVPFLLHVIADLTGFMGGNLFYPFTKERTEGFKLFHASSSIANFFSIWACVLIIIYNINRFSSEPVFEMSPFLYFPIFWGVPFALTIGVDRIFEIRRENLSDEEEEKSEISMEMKEGS